MEKILALYAIYFIIVLALTVFGNADHLQRVENWLRSSLRPKPTMNPQRNHNHTQPRTTNYFQQTIPLHASIHVSNLLYHGTPRPDSAHNILLHNKFLSKNHSPQGLYVSDRFENAKVYASINGNVVLLLNSIPAMYAVNINDVYKDPRLSQWNLSFGYSGISLSRFIFEVLNKRLVKVSDNVLVAVVPYCHQGKYYRIEGLRPIKILDRNRNIVRSVN